jgi:PAS domain S-box-containing protein
MSEAEEGSRRLRFNEEWYRVTLNSIGDAVIATDSEGKVIFMNPRAEELTGWPQAEASGKSLPEVFDIVNETTRQRVDNPVEKVLQHGQVVGLANHTVLLNRFGKEFAIDDSAAPIRDGTQALSGVVLVFHDVTEARRAWLARRRLAAIVECSDDAIVGKNLDGIITDWNKSAERIFGYTAAEAIGKSVTLIIPPDRLQEEPAILARLRNGERVDHFETIRLHKTGRPVNISLTISPIRDDEGHIVGASKVARDITAQKAAELAVRQAQAQLEAHAVTLEQRVAERTDKLVEVNRSLESLSYSIAHDLRSPLRAIRGMTEILIEDHPTRFDANGQKVAKDIINAVQRMDMLINDLMTFGRLAHDELQLQPVRVSSVVQTVLRNLQTEGAAAGAQFEIAPELPTVMANQTTLVQVLANLVGNALKFTESTRPAKVRIYATVGDNSDPRIVVEDNGIGIKPEFLERIYRIFERLHAGSTYPGTGIGLAIVQKGVERMGGKTGVESEPGKGSRFWVQLPLAR